MTSPNPKFPWILFLIIILLLGVNLYFSFTNPVTAVSQKLGLANNLFRLILSISFVVPIFVSFFFGTWSYTLLLKKPEFHLFAKSILILTLVLLIGSILGTIRSHFFSADTYGMYKNFTIIINYIYSFGYLIGFGLLLFSTKILLPMVKNWNAPVSILITSILGIFYTIMLLTSPDKTVSSMPDIKPSYFLGDSWIVFTIILPTIFGWFFAVWAAFQLSDICGVTTTTTTTTTTTYKEGIKNILYGILFIVFSVIILQAVLSVGTSRFIASGLVLVLVILYSFVAIFTVGNFLVLKGARKITQAA